MSGLATRHFYWFAPKHTEIEFEHNVKIFLCASFYIITGKSL